MPFHCPSPTASSTVCSPGTFTGDGLAQELGGGEILHDGRWFVAVAVR
jgi:hypothetical protein